MSLEANYKGRRFARILIKFSAGLCSFSPFLRLWLISQVNSSFSNFNTNANSVLHIDSLRPDFSYLNSSWIKIRGFTIYTISSFFPFFFLFLTLRTKQNCNLINVRWILNYLTWFSTAEFYKRILRAWVKKSDPNKLYTSIDFTLNIWIYLHVTCSDSNFP